MFTLKRKEVYQVSDIYMLNHILIDHVRIEYSQHFEKDSFLKKAPAAWLVYCKFVVTLTS
jgi:hypothetical protein